jgi:hypothetical protein
MVGRDGDNEIMREEKGILRNKIYIFLQSSQMLPPYIVNHTSFPPPLLINQS